MVDLDNLADDVIVSVRNFLCATEFNRSDARWIARSHLLALVAAMVEAPPEVRREHAERARHLDWCAVWRGLECSTRGMCAGVVELEAVQRKITVSGRGVPLATLVEDRERRRKEPKLEETREWMSKEIFYLSDGAVWYPLRIALADVEGKLRARRRRARLGRDVK